MDRERKIELILRQLNGYAAQHSHSFRYKREDAEGLFDFLNTPVGMPVEDHDGVSVMVRKQ